MGILILSVAVVLILVIVVVRRPPVNIIDSNTPTRWLLVVDLVLMLIYAVFWLFFGIAEMMSGDLSGLIHVVPSILLVVLMFLAWRRPVEGGIALLILGVLASLYNGIATMQGGRAFQATSLLDGVPYVVFGLLFLVAAALTRRK